jgi:hypothetical protein
MKMAVSWVVTPCSLLIFTDVSEVLTAPVMMEDKDDSLLECCTM